jgi:DNA/RNA endonuclease YhcR with UshA esterase domain
MVEAAVVVSVESLVVAKAASKIVEGTGSITMVIVEGTKAPTLMSF